MPKIKITENDIEKITAEKTPSATKLEKNSQEYEKLLKELDEIANKYEFPLTEKKTVDENINLARKDYVSMTDDEINEKAKNSLADYKNSTINAIENENATKQANLENKLVEYKENAKNDKIATSNYYDTAKQNAENDALKRGLSRSSIIVNTLSAFDQQRLNKLTEIDEKLTAQIESLNDQINLLNLEKQKAMDNFNIDYATKLNVKIDELKTDLKKRNDEVTEYNNKIAQIEKEYNENAIKTNNDIKSQAYSELLQRVKFFIDNGEELTTAVEKENYKVITDFLYNIDTAEALEFLLNNEYLRKMLGSQYSAVLSYLRRKGE